jgi:hypothetical protein
MKYAVEIAYILAAFLFIFGIKQLSSPETARRGNLLSAIGMLLAVIVTLLHRDILDYRWIAVGLVAGTIVGALAARLVAMTAMPGMVGLLNGSGGLASLLVAWEAYHRDQSPDGFTAVTIVLSIIIGGQTDPVFRPASRQWRTAAGGVGRQRDLLSQPGRQLPGVSGHCCRCAFARSHECHPDWRRGHARGDFPAEQLFGSGRLRHRFCAQE